MSAEPITGLSGKRYGEVLLVTPGEAGLQASVYNSFGLNDCPAELWSALDAQAIAAENGAATALLNGPRYWLMNEIEKTNQGPRIIKNFGGIDMVLQAQTLLSGMNPRPTPPIRSTGTPSSPLTPAKRSTNCTTPRCGGG